MLPSNPESRDEVLSIEAKMTQEILGAGRQGKGHRFSHFYPIIGALEETYYLRRTRDADGKRNPA